MVAVSIVGVVATIVSQSDTEVIVQAGAGDAGAGHIILTSNTGAYVSLEGGFTYRAGGSIRLLSPSRGQFGTYVSIHGDGLLGSGNSTTSVQLGGVEVAEVISASGTLIKVRADASASTGVGGVVIVSNSGSVVQTANLWTYDVHSNITDVCV